MSTAAGDDARDRAPRAVGEVIAAACERQRSGQSHGDVAATLRTLTEERRRAMITRYARGDVAAARYSALLNEILASLYNEGARQHPSAAGGLAIVAVGGFGRDELAPYSDVDLLFLHMGEAAGVKPLLDFVLYPLWDAGLKVGHAVHTAPSAVAFVQGDIVGRTAYLDARYLAGKKAIYADFAVRFGKLRKRTKTQFAAAKRAEFEARHDKADQSRYLAEPDLKEGKGGLRDLHTIAWMFRYEFDRGLDSAGAAKSMLGPEGLAAFRRCERFLWSVRVQLHGLRGRADEKVAFDVQPALAEKLGYVDRGGMLSAERLMKDYFLNALEVGRLARLFMANLDEERSRLSPRALRLLPKSLSSDEAGGKANLKLTFSRLNFASPERARKSPLDLFRLFRAHGKRPEFDVHPDALALVAASAETLTPERRKEQAIANVFLATLLRSKDPASTLRLMAEAGLLGRYIPSFGKIIGRIEYGLYRRYTVDENVFRSLSVLAEIERGEAKERHPIATSIVAGAKDRAPFYVAVLLHETIWSMREPSVESCEKLVARIARRLGLSEGDASAVGWAAARHNDMVKTVERRNLAEPQALARFAESVGDKQRLDLLLVLSVCHMRTIAAFSWDDWTRRQLSELYRAAAAFLEAGEAGLAARLEERVDGGRAVARALLADWTEAEKDAFLAGLNTEAFLTLDADMLARIGDLARSAAKEGARAAVALRQREGDLEAIIYADDRIGLLADIAGAISSAGVSVRSVQALTTLDRKAIDAITLQSVDGAPLTDGELIRRLHARLLEAAKSPPSEAPTPARRIGDRRDIFHVPSVVRLDLEASESSVVVEAEGRDRPGLLYELTSALADLGVTIISAHIATYGERAVDSFYLQDAPGYKITNKRRLQSIERRLLNVLSAGETRRSSLTVKP